jgi:histidinol phosphatase-like enzyme (inositol monophosphatase family)
MDSMDEWIGFSKELAQASGDIIRRYFRVPINVETKADRTPLTIADQEAERCMRALIQARYPHHGILGEEFETINPGADYQWVLDPIDGTKNFVAGTTLFGTLIGLMKEGRPILGVIHNPITAQFLVGDGMHCWLNDEAVRVRDCSAIEEATLLTTSHWSVFRYQDGPAFEALSKRVKRYRTWGDCYGYYLVASGYADIMIDPAMHLWDVVALVPILEGAGGCITDYYGGDPLSAQGAVATAGPIHEEVIRALNPEKIK